MRAIINSRKHIVQLTLSTVAAGAQVGVQLVNSKQNADNALAVDVEPGTVVKAIYVEMWLLAAEAQPSTVTAIIVKSPSGLGTPSAIEFADLHTWSNKNNIFVMHQGIVGDANSNPIPVFREWIKIPKGKQRFSLGDKLEIAFKGITEDTEVCGFAVYKSYN